MSELQIFQNPQFGEIRTITKDGEPWFVGKDTAAALGYKDTVNALKAHVDDEDKAGWRIATQFGEKETIIINESGVYSLIFSSKLEKAREFKHWVTSEVLPSIRKQGAYLSPAVEKQLGALLTEFRKLAARVELLEDAVTAPIFGTPALLSPPAEGARRQAPGREYMRRWMRTASDKLNLMGNKYNLSSNAVLHQLYGFLEKEFGVSLAEERIRIMEEYGLEDCSTLKAVFYDDDLRDRIEAMVDSYLSPENRGW